MKTPNHSCLLALFTATALGAGAGPETNPAAPALEPGPALRRPIAGAELHAYEVALERGEYALVDVHQLGADVVVEFFGPDGAKLKEVDGPTGDQGSELVAWIAESSGAYRLSVRMLEPGDPAGSYTVELAERVRRGQRIGFREPLVSPRLMALASALESGQKGALEELWREVASRGTPLVEEIAGEPQSVWVTFLYRGREDTANVFVLGDLVLPWPRGRMVRLGDSDVFFKTLRLPREARFTYKLSVDDSEVPLGDVDWSNEREATRRVVTLRLDPLNPNRFPEDEAVPAEFAFSAVELPGAVVEPWWQKQPGVPAGEVNDELFTSDILGNTRRVLSYLPPGYSPGGGPYDLAIFLGGQVYIGEVPVPTVLDNLLAAGKLRPTIALLVASPGQEARNRELGCYPPYLEFLLRELLPWARERYPSLTTDPRRTTISGFSLGGLAAAFAGLEHPEVFGNVLSQAGSFWWKPDNESEFEWLTRRFASQPRAAANFYVEVGILEKGPTTPDAPTNLVANRHFRDVLLAKGYPLVYREVAGDHQSTSWRNSLAEALLRLAQLPATGGEGGER